MSTPALRVLIVDDEDDLRKSVVKLMQRAGFAPTPASSALHARELLAKQEFDVVVSDVNMPGLSGVELLAELRERDADLPVILVTGMPQLESAMMALNLGAYRYLTKPVDPADLEREVRRAGLIHSFALLKRRALESVGAEDAGRLELDRHLDASIDSLWMAWQPIVRARGKELLGFEALVRTDAADLRRPDQLLAAAQQLNRSNELGRAVRRFVADFLPTAPADATVFLNLLPSDLLDPELLDADSPLSAAAPRIVLELTERASLDSVPNLNARVRHARDLGFRIAVDDLGAGYSGLTSLTQLEPDIVKLDMSLVRGIHASGARQKVVGSMVDLCQSMEIAVIAEGIEVPEEAETLYQLGIENLQGYLFGKPDRLMRWGAAA